MFTKGIGSMIRQKGMEYILIWMELNIKGNGKRINSMVREKKLGLMAQCMKVTMS